MASLSYKELKSIMIPSTSYVTPKLDYRGWKIRDTGWFKDAVAGYSNVMTAKKGKVELSLNESISLNEILGIPRKRDLFDRYDGLMLAVMQSEIDKEETEVADKALKLALGEAKVKKARPKNILIQIEALQRQLRVRTL